MRPEAEIWFRQATADLVAAKDSQSNSHYDWACFQAQQSAEKALKAFLYDKQFDQGRLRRIGHSLFGPGSALEACLEFEGSFSNLIREADLLNQHSIASRYPDAMTESIDQAPSEYYQREVARDCVTAAEAVLELVRRVAGSQ